jgi:hypothetical protein
VQCRHKFATPAATPAVHAWATVLSSAAAACMPTCTCAAGAAAASACSSSVSMSTNGAPTCSSQQHRGASLLRNVLSWCSSCCTAAADAALLPSPTAPPCLHNGSHAHRHCTQGAPRAATSAGSMPSWMPAGKHNLRGAMAPQACAASLHARARSVCHSSCSAAAAAGPP